MSISNSCCNLHSLLKAPGRKSFLTLLADEVDEMVGNELFMTKTLSGKQRFLVFFFCFLSKAVSASLEQMKFVKVFFTFSKEVPSFC